MDAGVILLVVIAAAAVFIIVIYNRLVALRQRCRQAFADVDVQLKQRHDLTPNLVETVKGYAAHESQTLEAVIAARSAAVRAEASGNVAAMGQAESVLGAALGRLLALSEAYPDLKANENFRALQTQLSDLENKIAAARRFFNNAVGEYNTGREQFPAVLFARALGFSPEEFFEIGEGERAQVETAPQVRFS
jgi:LemA protein